MKDITGSIDGFWGKITEKIEGHNSPSPIVASDLSFVSGLKPVYLPDLEISESEVEWVWEGFVARGHFTLFSALYKAGKSTLLSHLIKSIGEMKTFIGYPLISTKVLLISEESQNIWARRKEELQITSDCWAVFRPVKSRLTYQEWCKFLEKIAIESKEKEIGLVIIDTISGFWSVDNENDAAKVQAALLPLNHLLEANVGVLVIHHFRKSGGDEGTASRGSGVLGSSADVIVELSRLEKENPNSTQRVLKTYSRFEESPKEVVIELTPQGYIARGSVRDVSFDKKLDKVEAALKEYPEGSTVSVLFEGWGEEKMGKAPSRKTIERYLKELCVRQKVKILGTVKVGKTNANVYSAMAELENERQVTPDPKVVDEMTFDEIEGVFNE